MESEPRLDENTDYAPGRRYGKKTLEFVRATAAPVPAADDRSGAEHRAANDRDEIDQS